MEVHENDVQALHVLEEINYGCAVPFAFKSIVKMGIPDILGSWLVLARCSLHSRLPTRSLTNLPTQLANWAAFFASSPTRVSSQSLSPPPQRQVLRERPGS